jgi:tRNA A37 threonylcarbamoyladenosine modification protein TsaB
LPKLFETILKEYKPSKLYFAKGPGSFMAIKVTYLFLKTLHLVKNIPLLATDGFTFNDNNPIKAMGKSYFIKDKNGNISLKVFKDEIKHPFMLPKNLPYESFSEDTLPLYHLPAV